MLYMMCLKRYAIICRSDNSNEFTLDVLRVLLISAMASAFSFTADADGFRILEQTNAQIATANAGSSVITENASTAITNPAGLVWLEDAGVSVNTTVLSSVSRFENGASVTPFGPYVGNPGFSESSLVGIPNFSAYKKASDKVAVGLSVFAPYGLSTDYDDEWIGRYQTPKSEVVSVEINPVVSYQISDELSVGGGLSAQYFAADLATAIDFGVPCILTAGPTTCSQAAIAPYEVDGTSVLEGSDWGIGFNLGVLYQANAKTRWGATYRSSVRFDLEPSLTFSVPALPGPLQGLVDSPLTQDSTLAGALVLPQIVSVSVAHQLSDEVTLLGDLTWMDWSVFESVELEHQSGGQDVILDFGWHDNLKVSAGINYALNTDTTLRAGVSFVINQENKYAQNPILPDQDPIAIGAGLNFKMSDHLDVDLAYSHLFTAKAKVGGSSQGSAALSGQYSSNSHILGVQLNWRL